MQRGLFGIGWDVPESPTSDRSRVIAKVVPPSMKPKRCCSNLGGNRRRGYRQKHPIRVDAMRHRTGASDASVRTSNLAGRPSRSPKTQVVVARQTSEYRPLRRSDQQQRFPYKPAPQSPLPQLSEERLGFTPASSVGPQSQRTAIPCALLLPDHALERPLWSKASPSLKRCSRGDSGRWSTVRLAIPVGNYDACTFRIERMTLRQSVISILDPSGARTIAS